MSEDARSDVEKVLDCEMRYTDLGTKEKQAVVRKVVDEWIREDIASLNFEAEVIAQGRAWTDVDADRSQSSALQLGRCRHRPAKR